MGGEACLLLLKIVKYAIPLECDKKQQHRLEYNASIMQVKFCNEGGRSPSAPIDTSLTPLLQMKSRALFTLAILWKRILPLSGLGSLSPRR